MPLVGVKGKNKAREHRRSRSRNTTPSSVGTNLGLAQNGPAVTALAEVPLVPLMSPTHFPYDDILERNGGNPGIPETKHLDSLATELRRLAPMTDARITVCNIGVAALEGKKELAEKRVTKERQDRDFNREGRLEKLRKEATVKVEDLTAKDRKAAKVKKGKETAPPREERPLTHGAHGLARQDGLPKKKGTTSPPEIGKASIERDVSHAHIKREAASTSISSLSPPSHAPTPAAAAEIAAKKAVPDSPGSNSSLSERQPSPAPTISQYQIFGPDPTTFPDPTIYHIRDVTPGMSEDEIKQIYSVAEYPHDDLHDLVPGTPPDRDLSSAKPPNQVAANTFATYVEPYFRALTEEDVAFLREKGDRTQPFVIPRRGKRHYTDVWAEEDGAVSADMPQQLNKKLPPNQARGSIEQMSDEVAESDMISAGPMLSRLLASMRPERRPPPTEEKSAPTGIVNGETQESRDEPMDETQPNGDAEKPLPLPAATFIPDSALPGWKVPNTKLDYTQTDERLKQELRYIGFLGEDEEPDYDAHYDGEIAARLRYLQAELKEQCILNAARKARLTEIARERLAHQEYTTILEDLDNQVQQAYSRRTKSLGKSKKQQKRPGGAGGGSHYVASSSGSGVSRPGIGDAARTLMERRNKWIDSIGPVFEEGVTRIPKESLFGPDVMARFIVKEREGWEEGEE